MHKQIADHYGLSEDEWNAINRAESQFGTTNYSKLEKLFGLQSGTAAPKVINSRLSMQDIRNVRAALSKMKRPTRNVREMPTFD